MATQQNQTEQHHRPAWIQKAAVAVAAFYGTEHAKKNLETTEAKLKADAQATEQKIADIIHRHYQEHK